MTPDDLKNSYDDPLMSRVKRSENARAKKKEVPREPRSFPVATVVAGIALAAALGALAYYLIGAQNRIEELNTNLMASQERLVEVTERLGQSQEQIQGLETGLERSEIKIGQQGQELGRTRNLVTNLKDENAAQDKELKAIAIKKADQEAVEKLAEETSGLADRASGIEAEVGEVNDRLSQANSNIGELRDMTTANRGDIEGNRTAIGEVRTTADGNTGVIDGVKRSLEREYYNFELEKKGGIMKVFDVALNLKKTNFKDQKFTLEIIANGKRIQKKGHAINEPIFFYAGGDNKRYELLVNRIEKNLIVGYVSVPKTSDE